VAVSGEFNQWSADATPMIRQGDGAWKTTLALPPGRHQYKFVVDGHWMPDPNAREQVADGFGAVNSVIEVGG
jgi:1,4-alpha-glucan branching enzyme